MRDRSAAALSPKKRGRLPAERPGGIRRFIVGAMPFNDNCTELAKISGQAGYPPGRWAAEKSTTVQFVQ
jgi:hypothetical protein